MTVSLDPSPFHHGETQVQERAGTRESSERIGRRMIRDFLLDQHRDFFAQLPLVLIGSSSSSGELAVSALVGEPGFISTPTNRSIRFDALPAETDSGQSNFVVGRKIGILGIELPTRRRNRANGVITSVDGHGFTVEVEQSFGNCPKFIQPRSLMFCSRTPGRVVESTRLDSSAKALIEQADTFFVASRSAESEVGPQAGLDVSHRGGAPGFVVIDGNTLIVPDYKGNNAFNTLGNFAANPKAALLFVDFASGDLLHVSGRAELIWDGALVNELEGAQRAWKVVVHSIRFRPSSFELQGTTL